MSVRDAPPAPGFSPTGANEGLFGVLQAFIRSPQFAAVMRQQGLVPQNPGDIKPIAGFTPPAGWLLCDGGTYNISDYPALFGAIGKTWGGDGSKTFAVPDLRGRTLISRGVFTGVISLRTLGDYGGEETHQLTIAEMPSHAHTISDPGHKHPNFLNFGSGAVSSLTWAGNTFNDTTDTSTMGTATTGISVLTNGGNVAHNNMSPFAVVTYVIFTGV